MLYELDDASPKCTSIHINSSFVAWAISQRGAIDIWILVSRDSRSHGKISFILFLFFSLLYLFLEKWRGYFQFSNSFPSYSYGEPLGSRGFISKKYGQDYTNASSVV